MFIMSHYSVEFAEDFMKNLEDLAKSSRRKSKWAYFAQYLATAQKAREDKPYPKFTPKEISRLRRIFCLYPRTGRVCENCMSTDHLKNCTGCGLWFCSKECQKIAWKTNKKTCQPPIVLVTRPPHNPQSWFEMHRIGPSLIVEVDGEFRELFTSNKCYAMTTPESTTPTSGT